MYTLQSIMEKLKQVKPELKKISNYGYGSYARGEADKNSDIDTCRNEVLQ